MKDPGEQHMGHVCIYKTQETCEAGESGPAIFKHRATSLLAFPLHRVRLSPAVCRGCWLLLTVVSLHNSHGPTDEDGRKSCHRFFETRRPYA